MDATYKVVGDAVRAFLREEFESRYAYENLRRFRELKGIDPETVDAFRHFALTRLYPEGAARAEIDAAFAQLHEILLSPTKMASLGTVMLGSVLRLGRKLPKAVSAGQQVIHTYFCVSAVEAALRNAILEEGWSWRKGLNRDDLKGVFAELPDEPFKDLIDALRHLLELSANRDTMNAGLDLLEKIAKTMQSDTGKWTDAERRGVEMAKGTLTEAIDLSSRIEDRDIPRFMRGIEAVETHWLILIRSQK